MNFIIFTLGLLVGIISTFSVAYWFQKKDEKRLKQTVDQMPRWIYPHPKPIKMSEMMPDPNWHTPTEKPFNE